MRDPDGCPWDAEQTHASLRPNLLEECYEALEAMDTGDVKSLKEELGDLLIQIMFHADIASRTGDFDADAVCEATDRKLRRRHPHVFGDAAAIDSAAGVVDRWERIKREEAGGVRSIVSSVPRELPAVALAAILIRRASRSGIDMSEYTDAAQGDIEGVAGPEIGLGRWLMSQIASVQSKGVDPETALRTACSELRERVLKAESIAGDVALSDLDDSERDEIWLKTAPDR